MIKPDAIEFEYIVVQHIDNEEVKSVNNIVVENIATFLELAVVDSDND